MSLFCQESILCYFLSLKIYQNFSHNLQMYCSSYTFLSHFSLFVLNNTARNSCLCSLYPSSHSHLLLMTGCGDCKTSMNSTFPIYMVMEHCGQPPEMALILHPLIAGWRLPHFDQSLWSKYDTNRILISVFMWGLLSCLAWNSACETTHLTVERGATCLKPRSQLRCRTIHKCIALPATLRPMRDTSHLPANYQEDHTCMRKP